MDDQDPQPKTRFHTTQWSVVLRAGTAGSTEERQALSDLIEAYWYPLYAYSRRQGNTYHDARDLTQGFFTHLLSGQGLTTVSPDKGRFRSFLLAAFRNYMANEHRAACSIKRGGAVVTLPLSSIDFETRYNRETTSEASAEQVFERSWVETLLVRVQTRLAADYQRAGRQPLFDLLTPHLTHQEESLSQVEIGRQLNLSPAAVAMSLHRMRRRYGELLREEIAATVEHSDDVEDELRTLMAIISPSR